MQKAAPTSGPDAANLLGGRYQILRHLASGGMAEVHLARSTGIGGFERYVVLKRILADHARDPRFVTMFLDEARLAAQLHHQNIAQVYDIGEEAGTYFFAMEYVHGEDVRGLMRKVASLRRQVPVEHALAIVAGAAAGLHYAHEKRGPDRQPLGLVHRDVSPSNVLVAYDGAVKLVDFGIAKAATRSTETRSGTLKGKVAYMSPEQCLGKPLDRRSDVFSLGVVLYELTTLVRLFKFENDYVTMHQIVTGPVTPPSKRRADYPPDLDAIVMKCLEKDPEARYPTAGAVLEAIEHYAIEHRVVMSPQALGRYVRELFGERPEPWLELDTAAPRHVSLLDEDAPLTVTHSSVAPAPGVLTRETTPETGAPVEAVRQVRRRRWPVIAALVAASAAAGGVLAMRGGGSDPGEEKQPGTGTGTGTGTGQIESQSQTQTQITPDPVEPAPVVVPDAGAVVAEPEPAKTEPEPVKDEPRSTSRRGSKRSGKKEPATAKTEPDKEPVKTEPAKEPVKTTPGRDTSVLIRPSQKKDKPKEPE